MFEADANANNVVFRCTSYTKTAFDFLLRLAMQPSERKGKCTQSAPHSISTFFQSPQTTNKRPIPSAWRSGKSLTIGQCRVTDTCRKFTAQSSHHLNIYRKYAQPRFWSTHLHLRCAAIFTQAKAHVGSSKVQQVKVRVNELIQPIIWANRGKGWGKYT